MKQMLWLAMGVILSLAFALPTAAQDAPGIPDDAINAFPAPNVTPLGVDYGLLGEHTYRRVLDATSIYDAPDGDMIETLDAGYNYVSVWQFSDGWAQIGVDRWVREDALSGTVYPSGFSGVLIPESGMPYTVAWMLVNIRGSSQPGLVAEASQPMLNRYQLVNIYATATQLVNIYATATIGDWDWYQVGINQWVKQTNVARILPTPRPEGATTHRWVSIDLYEQVIIAYDGDRPVFASLVSSGLPQWSTNEGVFNVWLPLERTEMSGSEGQPDFYYLEDVTNTLYFDGPIALHGTYWHNSFGYRHSHGCVNLSLIDSDWLMAWAAPEWDGEQGMSVYVYSSGEYV